MIFISILVSERLSMVLSIWSVASERRSSSVVDGSIVGEFEYWSCTGESVEESSDERLELNEGFFVFFGEGVVRGGCCVRGEEVDVRRV